LWYSIAVALASIGLFIGILLITLGPFFSTDSVTTIASKLSSKSFLNNEFASAISLSASFALILPIIYSIARLTKTQQRNAEISSLSLRIRDTRSKIVLKRQEEITYTSEVWSTIIGTDIKHMIESLENILHNNYKITDLNADIFKSLISRYSQYEGKLRFKYAKYLGHKFNIVDGAILSFIKLAERKDLQSLPLQENSERIKSTISLLDRALDSLRSSKGGTRGTRGRGNKGNGGPGDGGNEGRGDGGNEGRGDGGNEGRGDRGNQLVQGDYGITGANEFGQADYSLALNP
jgi:hypothetical protein